MPIQQKIRVAIGPARNYPSWNWIGPDTADELSKYYEVVVFGERDVPKSDVVLFVKRHLSPSWLRRGPLKTAKVIYLPVDFFESEAEIKKEEEFLNSCSAILIHCARLRPYLEPLNKNVWPIDHHNRFGLKEGIPFRESGYVLWIGGFQYVPYLLKWMETSRLPHELKILTDFKAGGIRARSAASRLTSRLGVNFSVRNATINGQPMIEWSESSQRELMAQAKAAVDIKGGVENFSQFTKPPTKAQKFIASGIPFAANPSSYAVDHFLKRGFEVASTADFDRWFSEDYWLKTSRERLRLQEHLSLESVGLKLKDYIHRVL